MPKTIKTTCLYCGVGCGILMTQENSNKWISKEDDKHPANFGRLCIKGVKLPETLSTQDRLKYPQINSKDANWDDALEYMAKEFKDSIKKYGANSVAFYVLGQLLSEDYYIANKLMKWFIGSSNIDTNSRLCMSSSVAGHKRAFGSDSVAGSYKDFDYATLIILVGSNMAYSHPIIFQRIKQAKLNNPKLKIISINPQITATNEIVDLYLAINSGSDGFIFNSLLGYLYNNDLMDNDFISNYTNNIKEVIQNLKNYDYSIKKTCKICDISLKDMEEFINLFTTNDKVVTIYSQGINQSNSGTNKVNALAWGEKDGTITNSDRTISRQKKFINNAKANWEIIQEVANKMGFKKGFNYKNTYEIFIEHCKLSAFENENPTLENPNYKLRDFNLSFLSNLSLSQYNDLKPIQWPVINEKYPFIFNNGRLRDKWHTMERTAKSATLLRHTNEPYINLNNSNIIKYNFKEDELVNVYNDLSSIMLRIKKDYRYIHLDNEVLDFVLCFNQDYSLLPSRKYLSLIFDTKDYQKFLSDDNDYEDVGGNYY